MFSQTLYSFRASAMEPLFAPRMVERRWGWVRFLPIRLITYYAERVARPKEQA